MLITINQQPLISWYTIDGNNIGALKKGNNQFVHFHNIELFSIASKVIVNF